MTSRPNLFISYAREDRLLMERVRERLTLEGFDVWTDEGIAEGAPSWQLAIERAVEEAEGLVCVLTPAAKRSTWVREELVYATFQGKPIYMLHALGDYREVAILGFTVAQLVDVRQKSQWETGLAQLCRRIRATVQERHGVDPTRLADPEPGGATRASSGGDLPGSQVEEIVRHFIPPAIPATERHALVAVAGPAHFARPTYRLDGILGTLGRDPGSLIRIDEESVSREHAQLLFTSGGFVLRDLDSTNGTFVNGARVKIRVLRNGDVIRIGLTCSLRYVVVPAASGRPTAPALLHAG